MPPHGRPSPVNDKASGPPPSGALSFYWALKVLPCRGSCHGSRGGLAVPFLPWQSRREPDLPESRARMPQNRRERLPPCVDTSRLRKRLRRALRGPDCQTPDRSGMRNAEAFPCSAEVCSAKLRPETLARQGLAGQGCAGGNHSGNHFAGRYHLLAPCLHPVSAWLVDEMVALAVARKMDDAASARPARRF